MATTKTPTAKTAKSQPLKKASTTASTAVAVKRSTSVVSIQEELRKQASEAGNRIMPATGNKIRVTQDKKFVLPDGTTTPGPLELVVVEFAAVNNFYEGDYKQGDNSPPSCYAVGADPKKMFPAANSPARQSDDCQSCPNNQWGSKGAGKACGNGRLLAVLPPDADPDTPLWLLQPSATAIKGFDGFVAGVVRSFQSMPISVVTTVSFDENETYAKMVFSDPKPNPNVVEHFSRQEEARELLYAERDVSGYTPMQAPVGRKQVRR
jgi:hypothetical protein